jgi:hypothetical protein
VDYLGKEETERRKERRMKRELERERRECRKIMD